jgi:hypothetical protein
MQASAQPAPAAGGGSVTDQTLDTLRQVLEWLKSLWEQGTAPDGADAIVELVARALEEARVDG